MKLSLAELNYNLGHVLHRQGDLAGAADAFQQAIAAEPEMMAARHSLAVVLSEQGCDQAAAEQYRWIIQRQPNSASSAKAYHNLGTVLARQSQPAAALACFQQLLQLEPDSPTAHTGSALAQLALRQFDPAFAHFRQALWPHRQQILAFCVWAEQLTGQDELTLARQACGRLLLALLHPHSDQGFSDPGSERRHEPDAEYYREASSSVKSALNLALRPVPPASMKLRQALGETCQHLGDLLMRYGGAAQLRQAEAYYQQALQCQPQPLALYLKLADCLIEQQRWNAAILLYRLALTIHPNSVSLYQNLGWLLEQQQQWSEAVSCYRKAWQLVELEQDEDLAQRHLSNARSAFAELDGQTCFTVQSSLATGSATGSSIGSVNHRAGIPALCTTLNWINQNTGCYIPLTVASGLPRPGSVASSTPAITAPAIPSRPACANCQGLNCQRCLQEIVTQFAPVQLQPGIYRCQARALNLKPPAYFVAQIPNGIAQLTPYETPWLVTNALAVLTPDRSPLSDLSREYPGQLPTCTAAPSFPRILNAAAAVPQPVSGSVAVLAGLSGHNYFHWMLDVLPRLELLRRSGLPDPDWFWINSPDFAFQRETLAALGIPAARLLPADRWPAIQAEQLIAPAFAGHLGWAEPWTLDWLRRQFLPLASANLPQPERIYISRNRAHHRRLLNEAAVLEQLQAVGFVSVELESLPLAEQIALFAQAKIIIAPHGGGLTNTIFCQPGTTVVELVAPSYIRTYYWIISHHLGLRHYYIKGPSATCPPIHQLMYPSPLLEDIWIDLDRLNGLLRQLDLI